MSGEMKKSLAFLAPSMLLSWLLVAVFAMVGGADGGAASSAMTIVYVLIPGAVAVFLAKSVYQTSVKAELGLYFKPNRWFFAAWLIAPAIVLVVNEIGLRLPWNAYSPEMNGYFDLIEKSTSAEQAAKIREAIGHFPIPFFWVIFLQGMIGGITIGAFFALFEEVGFRGFLLKRLAGKGFWTTAIITGLVWGVWAAPLVFLKQQLFTQPLYAAGMMILYCLAASPLYLYIRLKSGSAVGSAVFGGTLNGLATLPMMMVEEQNHLTVGMNGLPGIIGLVLAVVLVAAFDRFVSDNPVTKDGAVDPV